ncbi:MAG: hypothetical protein JNM72_17745 [Deltaproteobacteria bacterium]|jgi:hypothetical protein|nr:hypothetical protein [Deltaproteobacteria bacterium]
MIDASTPRARSWLLGSSSAALFASALALAPALVSGCDVAQKLGVKTPEAGLNRVDLVKSPSANKLLSWGCFEYFGSATCQVAGFNNKPDRDNMRFSFDIVFDLNNDNNFGIPLVEVLMGVAVFDDNNLGAVCISFCDPDKEDCVPTTDAEGACDADNAQDVQSAGDIIPTKDEMLELASDVVNGTTEENWQFKTIPANGSTEAHIQFDFDIGVMLGILEDLFNEAVSSYLDGRTPDWIIPYSMEGSVFFDVPNLGNYAAGFGPFDAEWQVGG